MVQQVKWKTRSSLTGNHRKSIFATGQMKKQESKCTGGPKIQCKSNNKSSGARGHTKHQMLQQARNKQKQFGARGHTERHSQMKYGAYRKSYCGTFQMQ